MSSPKLQYEPVNGPWGPPQAKYENGEASLQAGHSVNGKARYAWVWPKDGKHQNWWGRWKDIMTGRGPDMHVAVNNCMRHAKQDWPSKARWSKWDDLTDPSVDHEKSKLSIPLAKHGLDERYDFRKRKYARPDKRTWTDVKWPNTTSDHPKRPKAFRDIDGQYWEQQRCWPDPKNW